jgi:hypothetical protein
MRYVIERGEMVQVFRAILYGLLFGHHWHGVAMPGHTGDDGAATDHQTIREMTVSEHFRNLLAKEVRPGTTLLLTDYPVLEHTTAIDMAVFSYSPEG